MMKIWAGDLLTWLKDYDWIIIIATIVFVLIVVLIIKKKAPKIKIQAPIEDEKIQSFIECYGGLENIVKVELDGRRLKLLLNQMDIVDIERFKSLGATGIFISGKQIKMVLPYDMKKLVDFIKFNQTEGKK